MTKPTVAANASSLPSRRSFLGTAAAGAAFVAVPAVAGASASVTPVEAELLRLKACYAATMERERETRAIHNEADRQYVAALRAAGEDKARREEVETRLWADCDAKESAWGAVLSEQDEIVGAACEIKATTLKEIFAKATILQVLLDTDMMHKDLALSIMHDLREMAQ